MDKKFNFKDNPYFLMAIVIIAISTVLIAYWSITTLSNKKDSSKDITFLQNTCTSISKINSTLKDCIEGESINVSKTPEALDSTIKKLNEIKDSIDRVSISADLNHLKNDLLTSLNYNISFYNKAKNILKNPKDPNISDAFKDLQIEKDNFINSITAFNNKNIDYTLPIDAETFVDNCITYIKNLTKINRDLSINKSSIKDYILSVSPIYTIINDINSDLFTPLEDSKGDLDALTRLENVVYKKQLSLYTAKNNFINLSVPNNCVNNYTQLDNTIKSCQNYLNSLRTSIKNSIADTSSLKYEEAKENFKNFKEDLENFYTTYKELK